MSELLTVYRPIPARAPWGSVHVRWTDPTYLEMTVFHTVSRRDMVDRRCVDTHLQSAESQFTVQLTRASSGKVSVSVGLVRSYWRVDPRFTSALWPLDADDVRAWNRRITKWLSGWVNGRSSSAVLARAIAHHNAYVRARTQLPTIDQPRRPAFEKQMLHCLARARPATSWLLQLDRRLVREFVMLNYVPLIGRSARSLGVRDLNLDASPTEPG